MMNESQIDIAFLQEPYIIHNRLAGIPKKLRTYVSGNGRKRSAIIVNNKEIDAALITQLSDEDCIVVEISYRNKKFYGISCYFDITEDIELNIRKTEKILNYLKGQGILLAVDCNARSKTWYDTITNQRGKLLEDFLTIYNLNIVNERSEPTFETTRGCSYIDLTVVNDQLLRHVTNWTCGRQESLSDHKILTFNLGMGRQDKVINNTEHVGIRYVIKKEDFGKFDANFVTSMINKFNCEEKENLEIIDQELCNKVNFKEDVNGLVEATFSCITAACNKAFKVLRAGRHFNKMNTISWWSEELTVLRKRTNALRRKYQRTTNNENLRQERKEKYFDGRREYEGKMQEAKLKSWKKFCTINDGINPWNIVYKIASGKIRTSNTLTTLEKEDGTFTTDTRSTMTYMLKHFAPDDGEESYNELHKKIRKEIQEPLNTADDKDFTKEEIVANLEKFSPKKAPGEDGLTSDILARTFQVFPLFFTQIYNTCLKEGCFPQKWKHSVIIPIVKPGKEECNDVSKYRPISLINIGGKLLERLMIDRILFHIYSNDLFNNNQYGFTPQRGTIDAAMEVNNFTEEILRLKQCTIIFGLDVKGAFDSA
jgi:hypothetical protein